MEEKTNLIWLKEPAKEDNTFGKRGESALSWLKRSTAPRAKDCRRFLNENLSQIPNELHQNFQQNLKARWHSAFFELIVYRFLQELNASLEVEGSNSAGKKPDYTAHFADATIIVEAIAPVFDGELGEVLKHRIELLNFMESKIPAGWRVSVISLPELGPNDSKKEFKQVVSEMLNLPSAQEINIPFNSVRELATGRIEVRFYPSPLSKGALLEPGFAAFDNSQSRIRNAIHSKREQVRGSSLPVVLAIHASGLSSEFEAFDQALFGSTFERLNEKHESVEVGFTPNGIFNENQNSDKPPTFAGVLAFVNLGLWGGVDPVFYRHPRFSGLLPQAVLNLEQHIYDKETNSIQIEPPKVVNVLRNLKFVTI